MQVCVPGRGCCLGLRGSDRPSGSPGWLWQTGWDPPTPGALHDCLDRTHQPGRRPVREVKQEKHSVISDKKASKQHLYCNTVFFTCPAASVRPHRAFDADPTQSPNAATSPFLQFIEIPVMDSPRTWTEQRDQKRGRCFAELQGVRSMILFDSRGLLWSSPSHSWCSQSRRGHWPAHWDCPAFLWQPERQASRISQVINFTQGVEEQIIPIPFGTEQ